MMTVDCIQVLKGLRYSDVVVLYGYDVDGLKWFVFLVDGKMDESNYKMNGWVENSAENTVGVFHMKSHHSRALDDNEEGSSDVHMNLVMVNE